MRNSAGRVYRLWAGVWGMPDQESLTPSPSDSAHTLLWLMQTLIFNLGNKVSFWVIFVSVCLLKSFNRIELNKCLRSAWCCGWAYNKFLRIGMGSHWAAHNVGKTLPRGSAASARPSVYYTPPKYPSRLPTNTPHPPKWNVVCLPHSWMWMSMTRGVGEPD